MGLGLCLGPTQTGGFMKVDRVDEILAKLARLYYFQLPNIETDIQDTKIAISQARQELKDVVLECLHKELIIPTKEWNGMTKAQMDYVNGRNAENREVRNSIKELFK